MVDTLYQEFIKNAKTTTLVKVIRLGRNNHGYRYCVGPHQCDDGFYICELKHLLFFMNLYDDIGEIAWIEIPKGRRVKIIRYAPDPSAVTNAINVVPIHMFIKTNMISILGFLTIEQGLAGAKKVKAIQPP